MNLPHYRITGHWPAPGGGGAGFSCLVNAADEAGAREMALRRCRGPGAVVSVELLPDPPYAAEMARDQRRYER